MRKYFFLAYFLALQIIALKARIKPHALENMQRILAFMRNYLCLFENKQFNGALKSTLLLFTTISTGNAISSAFY